MRDTLLLTPLCFTTLSRFPWLMSMTPWVGRIEQRRIHWLFERSGRRLLQRRLRQRSMPIPDMRRSLTSGRSGGRASSRPDTARPVRVIVGNGGLRNSSGGFRRYRRRCAIRLSRFTPLDMLWQLWQFAGFLHFSPSGRPRHTCCQGRRLSSAFKDLVFSLPGLYKMLESAWRRGPL